MDSATFSRRWFLRAAATATVALVAARVVPIEAIPRTGELHQVLHADAVSRLKQAWSAHIRVHHQPPRQIRVGAALWRAYETELEAYQRFAYTDHMWNSLVFKGAPVFNSHREPWGIQMVARA